MLDVILALLALAAISVPVVTAAQRVPALPLAVESLTALFGLLAVILVLIRVLNLPGEAHGREIGLWLGLVATLGIFAGGLVGMRDERRPPPGRHVDPSGMPVSSQPEIEAAGAAPGPALDVRRLRISDWVVFIAAPRFSRPRRSGTAPRPATRRAGSSRRLAGGGPAERQAEAEVEREPAACRQRREERLRRTARPTGSS